MVAAAAASLTLGGVLCVWILAGVGVGWHADGWAAAAVLVCLAGGVVLGCGGCGAMGSLGGRDAGPAAAPALLEPVARRALGNRLVAAVAGAVVGATSLAVYAVRDPFHDPGCWVDCSLRNVAPLPSRSAAAMVVPALVVTELVVAVLAVTLAARLGARRRREAVGWPDRTIAGLAAVSATAFAILGLISDHDGRVATIAVGAAGLTVLGLAMAAQPVLAGLRRGRLRKLAFALGTAPAPGTLEPTLARALGDKDVRVAYWLPESLIYVDAAGTPMPSAADWTVRLTRGDEPLAALRLGRTDRDPGEVEQLVGSAARLAIDSERLQAEIRAQLGELRASRRRIVAAADDTRRSVERTIHDVVQAELLGALYELARARASAEQAGQRATADELGGIAEDVRGLIATIREFARGVYPAALDSAGLSAALGALADDAPVVAHDRQHAVHPAGS